MELSRSELQLETIVSRILAGELDLQPDFQRGEIWDSRRRQRLIDSILRNWYVPAVHIVQTETGDEIVLDGQQRLAAVRDFFQDGFKVDGRIDPHRDDIADLHGLTFSKLPEGFQRSMKRFALPVITLKQYEPQEPNELFFRLNQSYNLTPPEKRNALHGIARDQIREMVGDLESIGLLKAETVGFSNGRLAYDDIVSRTCLALERRDLGMHINNTGVEEFYRAKEFSSATTEGLARAAQDLLELIQNCPNRVRFNKGTLFSWLVYCFWSPEVTGVAIPREFLAKFEDSRARLKHGVSDEPGDITEPMRNAVALYDDRASYRVTDVSSVLARDFILHLYSVGTFGSPPVRGSDALLELLNAEKDASLQNLVFSYIDMTKWGTVIGMVKGTQS